MRGPFQSGTCVNPISPSEWDWEQKQLARGKRYRVIRPFIDADGDSHEVDEEWVFISAMFSKFDDLLTLCLRFPSGEDWSLPLIWRQDKQEEVVENFRTYVKQV